MKKADRLKQELVEKFGGKCQRCSYNKCLRALQFHHDDPSDKYAWSDNGRVSYDEVRAHPERFFLLCANCHFEEHDRLDKANHVFAECLNCGKTFRTVAWKKVSGRVKYCSRKCQHQKRREEAPSTVEARFWKYVQKTNGCWLWTGTSANGTGVLVSLSSDGKFRPKSVNRISYELHHGELNRRSQVRHTCHNSKCVNPEHLYV